MSHPQHPARTRARDPHRLGRHLTRLAAVLAAPALVAGLTNERTRPSCPDEVARMMR
jgi:hypothetical protein